MGETNEDVVSEVHEETLRDMLMSAPEGPAGHIDKSVKRSVAAWSDPPLALEVLRTLDDVVHGSLASGLIVTVLEVLYKQALEHEGKTDSEVVALAAWRDAKPTTPPAPSAFHDTSMTNQSLFRFNGPSVIVRVL